MSTIHTRESYVKGKITHEEYYSQFVTPEIRQAVADRFNVKRLQEAGEHFNGIPIAQWDNLGLSFHHALRDEFKERGDGLSISGVLCVLKVAARQIVETANQSNP